MRAVDNVSFQVNRGEFSIVGESGCGKSVTALSIMKLLPKRVAEIKADYVKFDGQDITNLSENEMRKFVDDECQ